MSIFGQPNQKEEFENKNFMLPQEVQSQKVLKKREEYAASLRKQKTKEILTQKRKKIAQNSKSQLIFEKNPNAEFQFCQKKNKKHIQFEVYQGYPEWNQKKNINLNEMITRILQQKDKVTFKKIDESFFNLQLEQQIQILLQFLSTNEQYQLDILAILTYIRQLLSQEHVSANVKKVLFESQLVPKILHFLSLKNQQFFEGNMTKYIKLESAWILTNLVFEEEDTINMIIDGVDYQTQNAFYGQKALRNRQDFYNILINILESYKDPEHVDFQLIDQVMHIFGNISGQSKELRQSMRSHIDLTFIMYSILKSYDSVQFSLSVNFIWILSNLCEDPSQLSLKEVKNITAIFSELLEMLEQIHSPQTLQQINLIIVSLVKLSRRSEFVSIISDIDNIEQPGYLIDQISQLMKSQNHDIAQNSLQYIGQVLWSENEQIINLTYKDEIIVQICQFLTENDSEVLKQSLWAISNFTASSQQHSDMFLQTNFGKNVVDLMNHKNIEIQMESAYSICNCIKESSFNAVEEFLNISNGQVLSNLKKCLKIKNSRLILTILETFQYILQYDLEMNGQIMQIFEQINLEDANFNLQLNQDDLQIYNKSKEFEKDLQTYRECVDKQKIQTGHPNQMDFEPFSI